MALIDEICAFLPIWVYPAREMLNSSIGFKLNPDSRLEIVKAYDGGQISGIICTVDLNGEILTVSLTCLIFPEDHPLKEKTDEYKKNRTAGLKAKHYVSGRNPNNKVNKKIFRPKECKKSVGNAFESLGLQAHLLSNDSQIYNLQFKITYATLY